MTSGNVVEILADGNVIGQATASGTSVVVTTDASTMLTNGDHTFTAIQVAKDQTVYVNEAGGLQPISKTADVPSQNSPAVQLTIDASLSVSVNNAAGQANPTSVSPINFLVQFNEPVTDFTASDVDFSGSTTPGTLVGTVTGSGTTYNLAVTGMTGSGTVTASIIAGTVHDEVGNANPASIGDSGVTYDTIRPSVTIVQAAGQVDPTMGSTIHFTVTFSEPVSDFITGDVTLGGTAYGKLVQTVTGSGTTYDVAVSGMTGNGTVVASVAAAVAHDAAGNSNVASTSSDNTVQFNLAAQPTFRLTAPNGGTFNVGQTVVIAWYNTNIIAGTNISLNYDTDRTPNYTEHWIEIEGVPAANGYGTYTQWDTSNVAPGTYYIAGYLWSGGKAIRSYCTTPITIVAPKPVFRLTAPTSGTYNVGQTVTVVWAASNFANGSDVSLFYDSDAVINRNEHYFEVGQAQANNLQTAGYGSYTWNTAGMSPGTYYIGGYLWSNGRPTWSHLAQAITLVAPKASFRITAPTSGSYAQGQDATIYWVASNFADGSTVNLFLDTDTAINGNEHYIEISKVTAANSGGYSHYTFTVPALAPGKYYVGGYLWSYGRPAWSHLMQPITITGPALMVDASVAPSGNVSALTEAQLQPIIVEAERRLTAATGIQVAAAMTGVSVEIGDLPANMLGEAEGSSIYISRTAAGYGWFVDSTPGDDSEFSDPRGPYALAAPAGSTAADRVDLLTTVMHEMTHLLGYDHSDSLDLMNPTLALGERRFFDEPLPPPTETSAIDQVFASTGGDARSWVSL